MMKLTDMEIKREIRNAYNWVYRHFDEYDGADTNDFMEELKHRDYFQFDTADDYVMNVTREKIEKLFAKRGYDPYWNSKN